MDNVISKRLITENISASNLRRLIPLTLVGELDVESKG